MNALMLQQVLASARTLPGKSAGTNGSADADSGFAALAQSLLSGDTTAAQGKSGKDDPINPLAAMLLAALFTQVQPLTSQETDDTAAQAAVTALGADSATAAQDTQTTAATQGFGVLLQALGLTQTQTEHFLQTLQTALQTTVASTADAQTTQTSEISGSAQAAPADEPANRIRTLLDKLLGNADLAADATATAAPVADLDTETALALRALLNRLQSSGEHKPLPAEASPRAVLATGDAVAKQAVAAAAAGQNTTGSEDASAGTDTGAAAANAAALPVSTAPVEQSAQDTNDVQAPRRTLGEAFDTMVDTLTSLRNSGKSEMEIRLKPDFLGKVVIRLSMQDGSLVARISASNASVQDAFQNQASQLTTALQQQGIKDVTVLVTHDMAAGSALDHSASRQQQNTREQRRRGQVSFDPAEKADAVRAAAAYEQFWRSGSVNYLA